MVNGHAPASPMQLGTATNEILQIDWRALLKEAISSMVRLPQAQHNGAWDCERAGQVHKDIGGPPGMTCVCVILHIVAATCE